MLRYFRFCLLAANFLSLSACTIPTHVFLGLDGADGSGSDAVIESVDSAPNDAIVSPDTSDVPDGSDADSGNDIPPPQLVAPLSTATVTSQQPTLRWNSANGATVQLCRNRMLTQNVNALFRSGVRAAAANSARARRLVLEYGR